RLSAHDADGHGAAGSIAGPGRVTTAGRRTSQDRSGTRGRPPSKRHSRRWWAPGIVAAAVAVLAVGTVLIVNHDSGGQAADSGALAHGVEVPIAGPGTE